MLKTLHSDGGLELGIHKQIDDPLCDGDGGIDFDWREKSEIQARKEPRWRTKMRPCVGGIPDFRMGGTRGRRSRIGMCYVLSGGTTYAANNGGREGG